MHVCLSNILYFKDFISNLQPITIIRFYYLLVLRKLTSTKKSGRNSVIVIF